MFDCNVNVDFPSGHPILSIYPYQFNDEEECEKITDDETTAGKKVTTCDMFDFADKFMAEELVPHYCR